MNVMFVAKNLQEQTHFCCIREHLWKKNLMNVMFVRNDLQMQATW